MSGSSRSSAVEVHVAPAERMPAAASQPGGWWSTLGAAAMRRPRMVTATVLLILIAAITWLLPPDVVLTAPHTDVINQFAASRAFAADSIRNGDFPLWNPFIYAGQPFLGGAQAGLLYPPNVVYLVLPLSRAINCSILLHLAIVGAGMAFWVSRRGWHPAAAAAAGVVLALSGPVLPHVYAGHLSNLCTLAWVPWAFAGLEDGWVRRKVGGVLLATAAIALQILGGQLQYVFFFGVAAALYALAASVAEPEVRTRALPMLALAVVGGSLLAAAQLFPSLAVTGESVRAERLSYEFAAAFALPPENLLTALWPGIFGGDPAGLAYWGRCYPWEMSVFLGITACAFAVVGLCARGGDRWRWVDLVLLAFLVVLALGSHLPTYRLLYEFVPGFDQFRGASKFTFFAVAFAVLLMASGIDRWLRGEVSPRRFASAAGAVAIGCAVVGVHLRAAPEWWTTWFASIRAEPENDFPAAWFAAPDFVARAAQHASDAMMIGAASAALLAGALLWAARRSERRWLALAIIPIELTLFAAAQTRLSSLELAVPDDVRATVEAHPGDYRVLNLLRPNNGYLLGAPDLWGNDPFVLKRYAEWMAFTQQVDPDRASQNLAFPTLHPLYAMLRGRFAFAHGAEGPNRAEFRGVLPRALLVHDYRVRSTRDAVFEELARDDFDPTRTVILEQEPSLQPVGEPGRGAVRVLDVTSDSLDLEVDTPVSALLLVTDLYSDGWRLRAIGESSQSTYEILPANYVLRAVPLAAGKHRLRMEYSAPGFALGSALTVIAALGCAMVGWRIRRAPRRPPNPASGLGFPQTA